MGGLKRWLTEVQLLILKRKWALIIAAACLACLALFYWSQTVRSHDEETIQGTLSAIRSSEAQRCALIDDTALKADCRLALETRLAETRQTLLTPRDGARASFILVFVGIFSIATSWLGIFLLYRTLSETRKATAAAEKVTEVTQKMGELQVQAYASVDAAKLTWTKNQIKIEYRLKNSGNSPAFQTTTKIKIRYGEPMSCSGVIGDIYINESTMHANSHRERIYELNFTNGWPNKQQLEFWVQFEVEYNTVFTNGREPQAITFFEGNVNTNTTTPLHPSSRKMPK